MATNTPTAIEVYSGHFLDLAAPSLEDLRTSDIAHAMSLICRYGGHIKRFYSVAEHSVLVHDLVSEMKATRFVRTAALYHDAAEAYLGDIPSPLKNAMRDGESATSPYESLTLTFEHHIGEKIGLDLPNLIDSPLIKIADVWALAIEAQALVTSGGRDWDLPRHKLPYNGRLPKGLHWTGGLAPEAARDLWLQRVMEANA